jgi:outer membrane protein assembly factor BamB
MHWGYLVFTVTLPMCVYVADVSPTPSPTPSTTPSPSPTPSGSPTMSPTRTPTPSPSPGFDIPWTQAGHDAQHSGVSTVGAPPGPLLQTLWTLSRPGSTLTPPVVDAAGVAYTASTNGSVLAVSSSSGSVVWTYNTSDAPMSVSPALGWGGLLFVSTTSGVTALTTASGSLAWRASVTGGAPGAPCLGVGLALYVSTSGGSLHAVHSLTGEVLWSFIAPGNASATSDPSTTLDGAVVMFAADNHVLAVNSSTGDLVWRVAVNATVVSEVVVDGSTAFVVTMAGLVAVDGGRNASVVVMAAAGSGTPRASVALGGHGTVLFTSPCCLVAVQASTGVEVWSRPLAVTGPALAVDAGGLVTFAAGSSGGGSVNYTALAGATGVEAYAYPATAGSGNGLVALGTNQVAVVAIEDTLVGLTSA